MRKDAQLQLDAIDEMSAEPMLGANRRDVAVSGSTVVLIGQVKTPPRRTLP